MTEKRYNVWDIDGTIFLEDHKEGSYHIGQAGNVDINCLNDIANRLNNLSEENEKLKNDCSNLIDDNTEYVAEINQMHKENEQLKQINQEIYELIAYYVTTHHSISTMRLFKKIKTLIKKGDLND